MENNTKSNQLCNLSFSSQQGVWKRADMPVSSSAATFINLKADVPSAPPPKGISRPEFCLTTTISIFSVFAVVIFASLY